MHVAMTMLLLLASLPAGEGPLVHPVWPPERGAPAPGWALDDEPLPPFGGQGWVDELPRVLGGSPVGRRPAEKASFAAVIVVATLVDSHGRVRDERVVTRPTPLDAEAVATVRCYRFAPARRNGRPVATWVSIPVHFSTY